MGLPLVSFTMNIAGPVKDTPLSRFAFQAGVAALTKRLGGPVSCCLTEAVTGCEALLVYDRPAQVLKDVCMELESTEVGRLYDLDVLDAAGEKLSRPEMRRCLVCGGPRCGLLPQPRAWLDAICAETARQARRIRLHNARRSCGGCPSRGGGAFPEARPCRRTHEWRTHGYGPSAHAPQRRDAPAVVLPGWSASGWTALHLRSCRIQDGRQRQRCCRRPAA